eukprot:4951457-Prymnesium_polylepis.2
MGRPVGQAEHRQGRRHHRRPGPHDCSKGREEHEVHGLPRFESSKQRYKGLGHQRDQHVGAEQHGEHEERIHVQGAHDRVVGAPHARIAAPITAEHGLEQAEPELEDETRHTGAVERGAIRARGVRDRPARPARRARRASRVTSGQSTAVVAVGRSGLLDLEQGEEAACKPDQCAHDEHQELGGVVKHLQGHEHERSECRRPFQKAGALRDPQKGDGDGDRGACEVRPQPQHTEAEAERGQDRRSELEAVEWVSKPQVAVGHYLVDLERHKLRRPGQQKERLNWRALRWERGEQHREQQLHEGRVQKPGLWLQHSKVDQLAPRLALGDGGASIDEGGACHRHLRIFKAPRH